MPSIDDFLTPVADEINLHVTHYHGGAKTPVICLPGLTRNARDFEDIGKQATVMDRDIYAISLRGRGRSSYAKDFQTYHPIVYRDDIISLMNALTIKTAIFLGTSLGGIITMLLNDIKPKMVTAAILNDIGPEFAPEGLARIAGYVGQNKNTENTLSFEGARERIKAINEIAFPGQDDIFWENFTRRTFHQQGQDKGWVLDYDPAIAKGFSEGEPPPDLIAPFTSLKDTPTQVFRGGISDLLSTEIVGRMKQLHPNFEYCEVPNVGHAPTLAEPIAGKRLVSFINEID